MEGGIKEVSFYRFGKAVNSIRTAEELLDNGNLSFAQNRAYYAAFDAIRSVTALDNFDSSKHSGIISYFNQNYVKTGIFPAEVSKIIRMAFMLREKSDYEDFYEPDYEDTELVIHQVNILINYIRDYLSEKGILSEF